MMRRRRFIGRAATVAGAAALTGGRSFLRAASPPDALLFRGGTLYDGTGAPGRAAELLVRGGRIAEIAAKVAARDATIVDIGGLALAPGFIDVHSHTDLQLLRDPRAESKVRQGVTTEVSGQDGDSPAWSDAEYPAARERYRAQGVDLDFKDVGGFLRWLDAHGAAVNLGSMIGTGTVRGLVIGETDRPASAEEMERMVALVRVALAAGACGVSSGLEYTPGAFADINELIALASPLAGTGLPFASHMRNEDDRLLGAIEEVIAVGQRAGTAVQISHLKAQGARNWRKLDDVIGMIEHARSAGIDVRFDVYPYEAYATGLSNLFPIWAREGGTTSFLARLHDPAVSPRIEQAVRDKIVALGSWDSVQMTAAADPAFSWVAGKRLGALAKEKGLEPYALLLQIIEGDRARTGSIGFGMSEANIARELAHPLAMVCSDGGAVTRANGVPHPRNYGTFPRVLGRFVRELHALPLEDAIHKMTLAPATRLRFHDRGRLGAGLAADLVAFDPASVADRATFENPHQFPVGIPHVLVNGEFVVRDGEHTGARPGRAVRPAHA